MRRHRGESERDGQAKQDRHRNQDRTRSSSTESAHTLRHRTIGNQAIQQLSDDGQLQAARVSRQIDPAEREADRVANQVTDTEVSLIDTVSSPDVQQKPPSERTTLSDGDAVRQSQTVRGRGQPLPWSVRGVFEPRFDREFGDVRVHTGAGADEAARTLNAEAFTQGKDIVFRRGRYAPDTVSGAELLAHELTHVVQQATTLGSAIQRQSASETREPRWLTQSVDPTSLSGKELRREIKSIQAWLSDHPVSGSERERLHNALEILEREVSRREKERAAKRKATTDIADAVIEAMDSQWFTTGPGLPAVLVKDELQKHDLTAEGIMRVFRVLEEKGRLTDTLALVQDRTFREFLRDKGVPWDFVFSKYEPGFFDSAQVVAGYTVGVSEFVTNIPRDLAATGEQIYVVLGSLFSQDLANRRDALIARIKEVVTHPIATAQEQAAQLRETLSNQMYNLNFFGAGRTIAHIVTGVLELASGAKAAMKTLRKLTKGIKGGSDRTGAGTGRSTEELDTAESETTRLEDELEELDIDGKEGKVDTPEVSISMLRRTRELLDTSLDEIPVFEALWKNAAKDIEQAKLVDDPGYFYKLHRRRFWRRVRKNDRAKARLEMAGFEFLESRGNDTAPVHKLMEDDKTGLLSLDHIKPKKNHPKKALDVDNLRFTVLGDNTMLENSSRKIEKILREAGVDEQVPLDEVLTKIENR